MDIRVPIRITTFILIALAFLSPSATHAQQFHHSSNPIGSQIYLVFPFENAGASPRLDWLGEGLEELTILRLSAAGRARPPRAKPCTLTPAASTSSIATDSPLAQN